MAHGPADAPSYSNKAHATGIAADAHTGYARGLGNTGAQGAGAGWACCQCPCFPALPALLCVHVHGMAALLECLPLKHRMNRLLCLCSRICIAPDPQQRIPLAHPLSHPATHAACSAETAHFATGGKAGLYPDNEHVDP